MAPIVAYDHQIFELQEFGGISRYFCEVAQRIPQVANLSTAVVAPAHFNAYLSASNTTTVIGHCRPWRYRGAHRVRRWLNRVIGPVSMHWLQPDIVHWTYFDPPLAPRRAKTIVTVYDMIHELFAEDFAADDPTSQAKRRCVELADHVICISDSTKADLMRLFGVPEAKISVTHLGYSSVFNARPDALVSNAAASRPFLLYVGQRRGYKGFVDALRAYAGSADLRAAFDFVAFGGRAFEAEELALIRSLQLSDGAVRRLQGGDDLLASTYRAAHALVYPSRYEGFGIPPLEAMASGCPVVCAATSSLPEVVGDAAQCFDPSNPGALVAAIEAACLDTPRRLELVRRGFERTRQFSWDRCARETAAVYERVMAA